MGVNDGIDQVGNKAAGEAAAALEVGVNSSSRHPKNALTLTHARTHTQSHTHTHSRKHPHAHTHAYSQNEIKSITDRCCLAGDKGISKVTQELS